MPELSDAEWILVILAVLYLFESLVWARPGVVPFISSWGGFASRPGLRRLTGNDQGDLLLGGTAPFDVTLLTEPLPLSVSEEGVVAFVAASPLQRERRQQTDQWSTWESLTDAKPQGRNVVAGDQVLCTVRSEYAAGRLAAQLRQIAQCDATDRPHAIEAWRDTCFSITAVRKRFAAWEESTVAVRIGATLLLLWIGPIGISLFYGWLPISPDMLATIIYLVILFALWWLTAAVGVMAHRYLYPDNLAGRWKQALYSILSPAVPMRLADSLGRDLFAFEHPLAVSAAIDSPARFRTVAESVARDAAYPRLPEEPPELSAPARSIVRQSRQADLRHLRQIVSAMAVDYQSLFEPPRRENQASLSYCPRCRSDFVVSGSHCEPCGNRETVPFAG